MITAIWGTSQCLKDYKLHNFLCKPLITEWLENLAETLFMLQLSDLISFWLERWHACFLVPLFFSFGTIESHVLHFVCKWQAWETLRIASHTSGQLLSQLLIIKSRSIAFWPGSGRAQASLSTPLRGLYFSHAHLELGSGRPMFPSLNQTLMTWVRGETSLCLSLVL